jgi:hypothetical protein
MYLFFCIFITSFIEEEEEEEEEKKHNNNKKRKLERDITINITTSVEFHEIFEDFKGYFISSYEVTFKRT